MKLKKAIDVLEQHKSTAEKFNMTVGKDKVSEAIDTVVEAFEDNSDDMCYHECPSCGSRCNCNDQPCSCCQEKTYTAKDMEAFAEWCLLNNGSTVVKIIKEQEPYIKFLSDELKQKDKIIEAQDEYILYLREAIDRVYIHLKNPSRYYDTEFLAKGDMIRNKIERNKNDI